MSHGLDRPKLTQIVLKFSNNCQIGVKFAVSSAAVIRVLNCEMNSKLKNLNPNWTAPEHHNQKERRIEVGRLCDLENCRWSERRRCRQSRRNQGFEDRGDEIGWGADWSPELGLELGQVKIEVTKPQIDTCIQEVVYCLGIGQGIVRLSPGFGVLGCKTKFGVFKLIVQLKQI